MTPQQFPEALEAALEEERREIDAIVRTSDIPTFENTLAALDRAGRMLDRVTRMFGVARENVTNPEYQALEREWQPKLAPQRMISCSTGLFERSKPYIGSCRAANWNPNRNASYAYQEYSCGGARGSTRRKNVCPGSIRSSRPGSLTFARRCSPMKTPGRSCRAMRISRDFPNRRRDGEAAAERGLTGKWAIVNTRSSVDPFLTFSSRRDLRETVWKKFKSRGDNGDTNDTKGTVARS